MSGDGVARGHWHYQAKRPASALVGCHPRGRAYVTGITFRSILSGGVIVRTCELAPAAWRCSPQSAAPQGWKQTVGTDVVRANDQDTAMRPSLFILGIFAAVLCVAQSAAAQDYPWCAYYGPHFGATNCGFSTFQQCLATISGIGGSCGANPMYQPAPGPHRSTRHPRHHPH